MSAKPTSHKSSRRGATDAPVSPAGRESVVRIRRSLMAAKARSVPADSIQQIADRSVLMRARLFARLAPQTFSPEANA